MDPIPLDFRLYLVRHASPHYQWEAVYPVDSDVHLTPEGWGQARRLARFFAEAKGAGVVYSSAMGRAHCTARIIAEAVGTTARIEPGLNEIAVFAPAEWGRYYGFLRRWLDGGGRAWRGFPRRRAIRDQVGLIHATLERILRRHGLCPSGRGFRIDGAMPSGNLIVVAHSGTIQAMVSRLFDLPVVQCLHQFADDFAGLVTVEFLDLGGQCLPVLKHFGPVEAAL